MDAKILCVGTLVADIFAGPVDGVISPESGFSVSVAPRPGGNALNVAVSLSKLGHAANRIHVASVAGDDMFALMFEKYLKTHGVARHIRKVKRAESAKCVIVGFGDNRRAFLGDKGANAHYTATELVCLIRRIKPDIFYAGETSSLPDVDAHIVEVLTEAKNVGAITVVDYIISSGTPSRRLFDAASLIDFFHINDYEAERLTGKKETKEALAVLVKNGMRLPVITAGEQPLVVAYRGRTMALPAFNVTYVDGTGAGDAFTAGFMKGLSERRGATFDEKINGEKGLLKLIAYAQAAGAAAVTGIGCTAGVCAKNVRAILRTGINVAQGRE